MQFLTGNCVTIGPIHPGAQAVAELAVWAQQLKRLDSLPASSPLSVPCDLGHFMEVRSLFHIPSHGMTDVT